MTNETQAQEQIQERQHWGDTTVGTGLGVGLAIAGILGGFGLLALGMEIGNSNSKRVVVQPAPQVQYADLNNDGTNEAFYNINGQVAIVAPEYNSRQR